MKSSRKFLPTLALLGLAGALTPGLAPQISSAATPQEIKAQSSASRRTDAAPGSTSTNASSPVRALIGGGLGFYVGQGGVDPKTWGMSHECNKRKLKSAHARHMGLYRYQRC